MRYPISGIEIRSNNTTDSRFKESVVMADGRFLMISRSTDRTPIVKIQMSEYGVCDDWSKYSVMPGRNYTLLNGDICASYTNDTIYKVIVHPTTFYDRCVINIYGYR